MSRQGYYTPAAAAAGSSPQRDAARKPPPMLASIAAAPNSVMHGDERVECIKCGGDGIMSCDMHKDYQKSCKSCWNLKPSGKRCHQCHGVGVVSAGSFKAFGTKFDGLEREITALMSDKHKLKALWSRMDFNGNNIVSLAEIDKLIVELYPLLDNKPSLMRAYKQVTGDAPEEMKDAFVHQVQFPALLRSIFYFNRVQVVFQAIDAGEDRRIDLAEFKSGLPKVGIALNDKDAELEFMRIDTNRGGEILFDEFCSWVASKKIPIGEDVLSAKAQVNLAPVKAPVKYGN
jgi:Ca2+-binding EF-hand superfamily protein